MSFGARIRQLRKQHDLTLRDLAERVGIDFTYLSKIENGKGDSPAESTIRKLASVLEVDSEELILLADKLPAAFESDLLARPEDQIAGLYRSLAGRKYSNDDWRDVLKLLEEKGNPQ